MVPRKRNRYTDHFVQRRGVGYRTKGRYVKVRKRRYDDAQVDPNDITPRPRRPRRDGDQETALGALETLAFDTL